MMTARMTSKVTAPAAMSLIKPIRASYSGWMKSQNFFDGGIEYFRAEDGETDHENKRSIGS